QRVADHGPRRRKLTTPIPTSSAAAPPNKSHAPSAAPVGGAVGGPVEARADPGVGDPAWAAACIGGLASPVGTGEVDACAGGGRPGTSRSPSNRSLAADTRPRPAGSAASR